MQAFQMKTLIREDPNFQPPQENAFSACETVDLPNTFRFNSLIP